MDGSLTALEGLELEDIRVNSGLEGLETGGKWLDKTQRLLEVWRKDLKVFWRAGGLEANDVFLRHVFWSTGGNIK